MPAHTLPRVLIVEDDQDARDMLAQFLVSEGFEPVHARDGVDAMAVVYAECPCAVLMDLMMPNMSGLEAIHQMRHDSKLSTVPILAMSAATHLLARAKELGVQHVLRKPLDLTHVARLLRSYRTRPAETGSPTA